MLLFSDGALDTPGRVPLGAPAQAGLIPWRQARSAPARLERGLSYPSHAFSLFFLFLVPLRPWGSGRRVRSRLRRPWELPGAARARTSQLVRGAGTAGTRFLCPFLLLLFIITIFAILFLWLLLLVPARLFGFIRRLGTGCASRPGVRAPRSLCPSPVGGPRAEPAPPPRAPAMLENSLPFELHPLPP